LYYNYSQHNSKFGGYIIKADDLKKDSTILEWLLMLHSRPSTEMNYLVGMQKYTEWTGKTPKELMDEAEKEIEDGKLMRHRNIKKYFFGFRQHLENSGIAPKTVQLQMSAIKSFYKLYDIEIPNLSGNRERARPLEKHKKIPTKDDLIEVLMVCDPIEKAVLLVGASSGLSAEEVTNLKVGEFKMGYDPHTEITTLSLRRKKTGCDFVTFLSPEASRAVWDYLNFRGRTEKTKNARRNMQLEKQRVVSDDGYLFINRHIPHIYLKTEEGEDEKKKKELEEMRKIQHTTFMHLYRDISLKAQKNTPTGDWNLIRSHNMRKFFNSALLNAGADSFFVEYCMGHTLDGTREAYFRATPDKLREIYKRYIPYLTIQKDLDISSTPDFKRLTKENEKLKADYVRAVVERAELKILRRELNEKLGIEGDGKTIHVSLKKLAKDLNFSKFKSED
jgi:site-specific recombinase XerD